MKKSFVFILITYIVAITFLVLSSGIPGSEDVSTLTGPRQWPMLLIIFILLLNSVFLINTLRNKNKEKEEDEEEETLLGNQEDVPEEVVPTTEKVKEGWKSYRHYILIVLMLLYLILLTFTNFLIATIVFFPLCSFLMGERKKITIAISSVIATFLVYGLFEHLLNVPLP